MTRRAVQPLPPLHRLLGVVTALVIGCTGCAGTPGGTPLGGRGATLQETAPPLAVQQVRERLAVHDPVVRITAPAPDAVLAEGPWTLDLQVQDWPIGDAGPLGPGPHVVVQIDDEAPRRITAVEEGQASLTLDPLSPGSHRITAYAARPWGEAVKSPQASSRLIVHRLAPLPGSQPAPGSAWMVPVSPDQREATGPIGTREPVLVDWLLWDAPLQHLSPGDDQWRLRITLNGDSVLVDRQTPLWLEGFRPGDNVLMLELLAATGEPLNPPFNAVVRGVRVDPRASGGPWLNGPLSERDLALVLGLPTDAGLESADPEASEEAVAPVGRETKPEPEPEPSVTDDDAAPAEPALSKAGDEVADPGIEADPGVETKPATEPAAPEAMVPEADPAEAGDSGTEAETDRQEPSAGTSPTELSPSNAEEEEPGEAPSPPLTAADQADAA
ncbi:hypothetical protein EVJ50_08195 [Synechococcus sp. RSCCF101]|uniref:hypothetical protein n=1 Tax=Synechococcus sp. RSCCF101 TaxID=2511069 RepID=UPI001248BF96|nr:hypothetical protein [Synechococcus sp. RSCCF101]QEY32208.1 hypothetical protein EVJ50_08195 [Synechococcus sp. RSCCF101]